MTGRYYEIDDDSLCNCAGWALRTYGWYTPYKDENEISELISDDRNWGLTNYQILEDITDYCMNNILYDFKDRYERINKCNIKDNDEVVAFRFGLSEDDDDDWDFHFRLFKDGEWTEKRSNDEITTNLKNDMYGNWVCNGYLYCGPIIYLRKVEE